MAVSFQYLICTSNCSSCNAFVHTLIKWNFETIRCFGFFKQEVFEIRGKSKIHNVTTFSLAQLERLDDFTICKHALKKLVQSQTQSEGEMAWCYFKSQKNSARKVLTGTKTLSTVLWLFWLSLLAGYLLDMPKNAVPIFKLWEIWISECFFLDAWLVKLVTPMFDISKLFWQECSMLAIYCVFF